MTVVAIVATAACLPTTSGPDWLLGVAAAQPGGGASLRTNRFFDDASAWNTRLGPETPMVPVPGDWADASLGLGSWSDAWGHTAIYHASPSDPLVSVYVVDQIYTARRKGGWRADGNSADAEAQIRGMMTAQPPYTVLPYATAVQGRTWRDGGAPAGINALREPPGGWPWKARVPTGVAPAQDIDGHMAVVQPDGQVLETFATIVLADGTIVCKMYNFTRADGDGAGDEMGLRASMVPNYAGVLRLRSIESGRIDHALALNAAALFLKEAAVPPAVAWDTNSRYTGEMPMGSRLAIPASVDLRSVGLRTDAGMMLARAFQEYGGIIVDRGGKKGAGITIYTDLAVRRQGVSPWNAPDPALRQDLGAIRKQLQLVVP